MNQEQRLDFLLEKLIGESDVHIAARPQTLEEKRDLLRALMNVRPPRPIDDAVLEVQDEYLRERAVEKGVVSLAGIPVIADRGSDCEFGDAISIWQGDITRLSCDAIVNAANSQMLGCFTPLHSCIDNFIHTYAGIQLRLECNRRMNELRAIHGEEYEQPTAVPMLTEAYNLPSRKVVHIVGPIVHPMLSEEHERQLRDCYTRTLDLCTGEDLRSVAFCCISTGVFRFPPRRASEIAIEAVTWWLGNHPDQVDRVIFNVFKDEDRILYERALCK
ncbi:MAG: protein-ADP-ribose hydrolase [Coriobacteriales bacterium]|jgi:O-acetyl-ADP-ribose deacetylase (regulator of RNase III)